MRWPRADVHQRNFADRRGFVEIVEETFGALGEIAVGVFTRRHDFTHDAHALRRGGGVARQHLITAGQHQAGDAEGEFVNRGFRIAVFVGQHFTLFGELDFTVHRAFRLREDGFVSRAAAASDGAATAVEQATFHTAGVSQFNHFHLRFEQLPAGRKNAAVLARVGVTQHHFLLVAGRLQQGFVNRVIEQRGQHAFNVVQVFNGFKQR